MLDYARKVAAEQETELTEERFEVMITSDAFLDPEDFYAICDNIHDEYYATDYGTVIDLEEAEAGLLKVRKAVVDKEIGEWG